MTFTFLPFLTALAAFIGVVYAESHTIKFVNNCGTGVPTLVQGGQAVPIDDEFTVQGEMQSSIGYLNTGCLLNGEKCVLLEMNLNNPTCAGCGPSVDLSLISPHAFNVPTAFQFYGGTTNQFGTAGSCDGLGAFCADENCSTAFHQSNDNQVQRACQLDNINLLVTFCGSGSSAFLPTVPGSLSNIGSQPANPSPQTQSKPTTSVASVAPPKTQAPSPAASSVPAAAPPISNKVVPSQVTTSVASIATVSSVPGAASNTSGGDPPSRSNTKTCKNKRRRRNAFANDATLSLKQKRRTGAGAHARAQDRARSFAGLAHL